MSIDDRCNRVGGIVKAVDEFKAERNQQRNAKQQKWQYADEWGPGRGDVPVNIIGGEEKSESDDC